MHPLRPPPRFFTFQRTLFMVVFLVEEQHYLSVAVPSMRASVLISFFFLRRGTSLPLPFSFPFLSYANELHRGNELLGKRGWGGSGGGAELRHILAFRVPPSHAFRVRFERPTRQEGSEFTQIRPGFREVCHIATVLSVLSEFLCRCFYEALRSLIVLQSLACVESVATVGARSPNIT